MNEPSKHAHTNTHAASSQMNKFTWICFANFFHLNISLVICYAEFFARIISASVLVAFKMLYFFFVHTIFVLFLFLFILLALFWRLFDCFHQSQRDLEFTLLRAGFFLSIFKRQKHIHAISFSETFSKQSVVFGLLALLFNSFFCLPRFFRSLFFRLCHLICEYFWPQWICNRSLFTVILVASDSPSKNSFLFFIETNYVM